MILAEKRGKAGVATVFSEFQKICAKSQRRLHLDLWPGVVGLGPKNRPDLGFALYASDRHFHTLVTASPRKEKVASMMPRFHRNPHTVLAVTLLCVGFATQVVRAALVVTISSSTISARAHYAPVGGGAASAAYSGTSIPTTYSLDAVQGPSQSLNDIVWTTDGSQTVLSIGMEHDRTGEAYVSHSSFAYTSSEDPWDGVGLPLTFKVSEDTTYSLSGTYKVTDVGDEGRDVFQFARLHDNTASVNLYNSSQSSTNVHNQQFDLGGAGLTGTLLAGHEYAWSFRASIAPGGGDLGASAEGNFTLTIGQPSAAVPEASCVLVWSLLSLAVTGYGCYRRERV